jgi:hypothetical protein
MLWAFTHEMQIDLDTCLDCDEEYGSKDNADDRRWPATGSTGTTGTSTS